MTNVSVVGNQSGGCGGGLFADSASPTLVNVDISENTAVTGGGVHTVTAGRRR